MCDLSPEYIEQLCGQTLVDACVEARHVTRASQTPRVRKARRQITRAMRRRSPVAMREALHGLRAANLTVLRFTPDYTGRSRRLQPELLAA